MDIPAHISRHSLCIQERNTYIRRGLEAKMALRSWWKAKCRTRYACKCVVQGRRQKVAQFRKPRHDKRHSTLQSSQNHFNCASAHHAPWCDAGPKHTVRLHRPLTAWAAGATPHAGTAQRHWAGS